MKIDSIKQNLQNLVLLGKEYREKVSPQEEEEIKNIRVAVENEKTVSEYDKQFYNTIQSYRKNWLEQIVYFSERAFLELGEKDRNDHYVWDYKKQLVLDRKKIEQVTKLLTKDESEFLFNLVHTLLFLPEQFDLEKFITIATKLDSILGQEQPVKTK